MRYSYTALVLATLAIGQVIAGPFHHAHLHHKKANDLLKVEAYVEKSILVGPDSYMENSVVDKREPSADDANSSLAERQVSNAATTTLSSAASSKLAALDCQVGINSWADNGGVWIGAGGTYTNTFINAAGEDLILVIWGPDASWVNANQPLVTLELPSGASQMVSFASGSIGAWSAVYSDTGSLNGQIVNTWGEYTMSPLGVVDVSREVNMSGHSMSIVGPTCTTDMTQCVFVCSSGNSCMTNYELLNCDPSVQPGAQYGTYGGFPSGGCGGLGDSAALYTTFS
jgi:hypothetical protein